ncbi:hypothetical protein WDZ92_29415 [Nostoc sp. NIES-2111]
MFTNLTAISVGALLLLVSGCAPKGCATDDIKIVFRDFSYVGMFAAVKDHPVPSHGDESLAMPSLIRPGYQYVFHTTTMVTTDRAAILVLPERLRAAHFSILEQPHDIGDFAVPNHGGPIWEIRFAKGSCKGRIYNRIDNALFASRPRWPTGSQDDYILEIED